MKTNLTPSNSLRVRICIYIYKTKKRVSHCHGCARNFSEQSAHLAPGRFT
jgi:hypothetical protein